MTKTVSHLNQQPGKIMGNTKKIEYIKEELRTTEDTYYRNLQVLAGLSNCIIFEDNYRNKEPYVTFSKLLKQAAKITELHKGFEELIGNPEKYYKELVSKFREMVSLYAEYNSLQKHNTSLFDKYKNDKYFNYFQELIKTQLYEHNRRVYQRKGDKDDVAIMETAISVSKKNINTRSINSLLKTPEGAKSENHIENINQAIQSSLEHVPTTIQKIEDVIITPVQRIPRYEMFIKDICKNMQKDDSRYEGEFDITHLRELIKSVASKVNRNITSYTEDSIVKKDSNRYFINDVLIRGFLQNPNRVSTRNAQDSIVDPVLRQILNESLELCDNLEGFSIDFVKPKKKDHLAKVNIYRDNVRIATVRMHTEAPYKKKSEYEISFDFKNIQNNQKSNIRNFFFEILDKMSALALNYDKIDIHSKERAAQIGLIKLANAYRHNTPDREKLKKQLKEKYPNLFGDKIFEAFSTLNDSEIAGFSHSFLKLHNSPPNEKLQELKGYYSLCKLVNQTQDKEGGHLIESFRNRIENIYKLFQGKIMLDFSTGIQAAFTTVNVKELDKHVTHALINAYEYRIDDRYNEATLVTKPIENFDCLNTFLAIHAAMLKKIPKSNDEHKEIKKQFILDMLLKPKSVEQVLDSQALFEKSNHEEDYDASCLSALAPIIHNLVRNNQNKIVEFAKENPKEQTSIILHDLHEQLKSTLPKEFLPFPLKKLMPFYEHCLHQSLGHTPYDESINSIQLSLNLMVRKYLDKKVDKQAKLKNLTPDVQEKYVQTMLLDCISGLQRKKHNNISIGRLYSWTNKTAFKEITKLLLENCETIKDINATINLFHNYMLDKAKNRTYSSDDISEQLETFRKALDLHYKVEKSNDNIFYNNREFFSQYADSYGSEKENKFTVRSRTTITSEEPLKVEVEINEKTFNLFDAKGFTQAYKALRIAEGKRFHKTRSSRKTQLKEITNCLDELYDPNSKQKDLNMDALHNLYEKILKFKTDLSKTDKGYKTSFWKGNPKHSKDSSLRKLLTVLKTEIDNNYTIENFKLNAKN